MGVEQAALSDWKDHQGLKQPDIPDAVKDSEGGVYRDQRCHPLLDFWAECNSHEDVRTDVLCRGSSGSGRPDCNGECKQY